MPIKKYGVYVTYAPSVDLRTEGLGRYLAAFIKGVQESGNIKLVIACPHWSKEGLIELLESENVPIDNVEIVTTASSPLLLQFFELVQNIKSRRQKKGRLWGKIRILFEENTDRFLKASAKATGWKGLLFFGGVGLSLLALLPLFLVLGGIYTFGKFFKKTLKFLMKRIGIGYFKNKLIAMMLGPKDSSLVLKLYDNMLDAESKRLVSLINNDQSISAWYVPTAYWPACSKIKKPKLICLPDLVLNDFPISFSFIGGDRYLYNFKSIEETIRSNSNFVTYSQYVKWHTLVDGHGVSSRNIFVIPHGVNRLDEYITIQQGDNRDLVGVNYAKTLLKNAIRGKAGLYGKGFENDNIRYLFYASQFRPNKNILTLLKAYNFLLKKQKIKHKLILTGHISQSDEVREYIAKKNLLEDVLCLNGLTVSELAACYKLADLAVNPSLSEGGCPFTFTEALSVDTPVIMADIAVTREILNDSLLQEKTFFDPYDYMGLTKKILWALDNKEELLVFQKPFFEKLSQRTWKDVANDHISALDEISKGQLL